MIGTGRVLGTRILRYGYFDFVHFRCIELNWTLYSARQDHGMVLVPSDQYQRAQTVKIKDQESVIKMVTPDEQATEMAMAKLKRVWDAVKKHTHKKEASYSTDSF